MATFIASISLSLVAAVAPVHINSHRQCSQLYTVKQDQRIADRIYRGTRKISKRNYKLLGYLERCQRNRTAQKFVRSYNRRAWRIHHQRVLFTRNPTPYSVLASWYDDAGSTACGFHATYGVANKTLPCGFRVELRHGGNSVEAIVEDRGPFIAGRSFDLNPSTKGALACSDLCYLQASATG